ncbi:MULTISPECIES: hypothetical protein [unclassified Pseudoalteromonas]|uniref:hypothetical protein n=1 Tax=Pseudoalteromonas TaxID=53246 RepID=UPI001430264F|nr:MULTISPECIES: hypothetical protein [unclassified Pseudoalteromonas]MCG9711037.1 hypothetical protein [Pseudoalteromonas sp. Isolate3]NIZ04925.1 hypothetical protein [Pseudoalteromonas sp. HF66]
MSESLKHAQWAKSIERKHRQSNVKKTKKSPLPIYAALASMLLSAALYYASYEKPIEYPPLSEAAKQRISQFFAKQFLLGQWRLDQIKYSTDAIQVYVRTPYSIALEGEALSQYLHYALCPVPSKQIWQDIQARELSVYVFTHSIRKGERTVCN